jgi:glutamate/aspartate transport system permease protein
MSSSVRGFIFFTTGMTFTLKLTFMAMIGGTVLGTILAMMRLSSNKLISLVATTYVNIRFRW